MPTDNHEERMRRAAQHADLQAQSERDLAEIVALREKLDATRAELRELLDSFEDCVPYVSNHFRDKWGYDKAIDRAHAFLRERS